jgi:hypothetical protein
MIICQDAFIQQLASPNRKLLLQGDLIKICKKKDIICRFWLFNDYLMYAGVQGTKEFTFKRALNVRTCSIVHSTSHQTGMDSALEVLGAEKSFVVMAPNAKIAAEWISKVREARVALGVAPDLVPGDEVNSHTANSMRLASAKDGNEVVNKGGVAPVWVPDKNANHCSMCNKARVFWTH